MSKPNYGSRMERAYEPTEGAGAIIIATSTSYTFGEYDQSKKWKQVGGTNRTVNYYKYAYRNAYIVKEDDLDFDVIQVDFDPTTAQFLVDILGDVTEDGIDTDIHLVDILHTGIQTPINLRLEELGGTNPTHAQAQGSFCTSCVITAQAKQPVHVVESWMFSILKDIDDYVMLTTAPTLAGGSDVSGSYRLHTVTYDKDGGSEEETSNVDTVQIEIKQNSYKKTDGSTDKVRKTTYEPIILTLSGKFINDTLWDSWRDRGVVDFEIKLYKEDGTNYIKLNVLNCNPVFMSKEGQILSGLDSMIIFNCENINGHFTFEGAGSFSDMFKGELS